MSDLATITSAIGSLKTAIEITKTLRGADLSLEKAEQKLQMAELLSTLADAKSEFADVKDLLLTKNQEIKSLNSALETDKKLIRKKDTNYYVLEDDLDGDKGVYCLTCWDSDRKLINLQLGEYSINCNICSARK